MRVTPSTKFWGIVAVLFVGAAVVLIKIGQERTEGFKELARNPGLWDEMSRAQEELDRLIEQATHWSDAQMGTAVKRFVFDAKTKRDAWGDSKVLKSLGAKVHPHVLALLSDESARARLVTVTGNDLVPEAPFNRACDLLGDTPPPESVAAVTGFLSQPNPYIRQDAALVLGKVGSSETVVPLRKALGDPEESVRAHGLIGLQFAVRNHRLSEQCRQELFNDVRRLMINGENDGEAAPLLVEFDAAQATELYLSESFFSSNTKSLHEALEAMADRKIRVPRDRLLKLIRELESGELKYPRTSMLGQAMRLLGQHQLPEDLAVLEQGLAHSEERVAEGAAEALLSFHGLEGFRERLWKKDKEHGVASLTEPQRLWLAVTLLDAEVNNGGLSQYFVNSSGDLWKAALAGLETVGARDRTAILREAVAKFGPAGPSTVRQNRQEQLAQLIRKHETPFDDLDRRYYSCKEVLEVFTTRYVIRNADAFK